MFSARHLAKNTTRMAAIARTGRTRPQAMPSVSQTTFRSFWEQKQSEYPKSAMKEQQKSSKGQEQAQKEDVKPNSVKPGTGFSPYFYGLLAFGVGLMSYGLYGFYEMMTLWPNEVRQDLRSGLRAKRKGDWDIAIQYLARAWDTARTIPRETFGDQTLLKISGIGITLAGALEEHGQIEKAYAIYQDVLWYLRTAYLGPNVAHLKNADLGTETIKVLTSAEKMRAIALAYKLGGLAHELDKPAEEEERWLVWSVEALLLTVLDATPTGKMEAVNTRDAQNAPHVKVIIENLGLPDWCEGYNIAAPFEALASFYSRHGNATYALPLYLQAISILLPPAPGISSIEDKCRGAQLMGNIAELILRNTPKDEHSSEAIFQAESWARKGLEIVSAARKASPKKCDVCEEAYAVLLYNMAMVRKLSGDEDRACQLLKESLEHSKAIGLEEGIKHANGALNGVNTNLEEPKPVALDPEIAAAAALE
ncbi:hypothetical protein BDN70DRAFT_871998 [Pholiota conissans]|uniref:Uncharacterized protein n=1 Tax=Pholiota conissans TaxID=109636 RepID=A0A9P5ZDN9_9AGAR|nr:hypothetical protein BDN70DRAFT_871998 [Pholiota conissans]